MDSIGWVIKGEKVKASAIVQKGKLPFFKKISEEYEEQQKLDLYLIADSF